MLFISTVSAIEIIMSCRQGLTLSEEELSRTDQEVFSQILDMDSRAKINIRHSTFERITLKSHQHFIKSDDT